MVWAYSRNKPSSRDSAATLKYHDARGVITLDLRSQKGDNSSPKEITLNRYERLIVLHALFVSFGFLILLPFGGIVARYTRTFTSKWIKVHRISNMFVALPIVALGLGSAMTAIRVNEGFHVNDVHQAGPVFSQNLFID